MPVQLDSRPNRASLECRVYERQSGDLRAACSPASAYGRAEARWDAIIRDLSSGGVKLLLRRRFEPGTALAIELPTEDESYTVLARIVHVRPHEEGWELGCQFVSALSESEQEQILAPRQKRVTTIPDVHVRLLGAAGQITAFRVRQFKTHSLWPLARGESLHLKGKGPDGREWKLAVRVASCQLVDGLWTLACRLGSALPAAKVLAALAQQHK